MDDWLDIPERDPEPPDEEMWPLYDPRYDDWYPDDER